MSKCSGPLTVSFVSTLDILKRNQWPEKVPGKRKQQPQEAKNATVLMQIVGESNV